MREDNLLHVYLADDDVDDREIFSDAIADICNECYVTASCNGEEFMVKLKGENTLPNLIFLDLNMPRKSGMDCLREVRANPLYSNIPVVIYSTSSNILHIETAKNLGATFYFIKPNSYTVLKTKLSEILYNDGPLQSDNHNFLV